MKILTAEQIKQADEFTIKNEPIASIDLMERAAAACVKWIRSRYDNTYSFAIFCGTGNNGGDGLAIARILIQHNFKVEVFIITLSKNISKDFEINLERLKGLAEVKYINDENQFNQIDISPKTTIIDAILGSGLSRPVDERIGKIIKGINNIKTKIISIDIPSGLRTENNSDSKAEYIIHANHTLSLEFPKLSFLFAENSLFTGEWFILPIGIHPDFIQNLKSFELISQSEVLPILKRRSKFSYKNNYGHALLIAGSYGKIGAAVLAAKACMRTGAGLLTTHLPKCGYEIMQNSFPEAMVNVDKNEYCLSGFSNLMENKIYQAIGIGPGLGQADETKMALKKIIKNTRSSIVIDADAINIIASENTLKELLPPNSILTPHIGEFERLIGKKTGNSYERLMYQKEFSEKYKVIIVLKGAYTSISTADDFCYFNSTGNPGMATAGSGDVLTGMILGLLSQQYSPLQAAILGVYLHGLAGDRATAKYGEEAMIATDIIDHIGDVYKNLAKHFSYLSQNSLIPNLTI
jgi:NAD(P)H-hydrate epimerase